MQPAQPQPTNTEGGSGTITRTYRTEFSKGGKRVFWGFQGAIVVVLVILLFMMFRANISFLGTGISIDRLDEFVVSASFVLVLLSFVIVLSIWLIGSLILGFILFLTREKIVTEVSKLI